MIVCDEVVLDPSQGRLSILGVIQEILCTRFPLTFPRLTLWAELSGGRGPLAIDFVVLWLAASPEGFLPMATRRTTATFRDPLRACIAGALFVALELPGPGEIVIRMASGGSIIMERRVRVALAPL